MRVEQKQAALQHFKEKAIKLESDLDNNKIFLNMVIHDLRNPTNQVDFLVNQTLGLLKDIKEQHNKNKEIFLNFIKNIKDGY